ncbi:hypothetical protein EPH95_06835 [Salicibibacter halophilus]|uniref:Uncharacterized protein n=1 Tax=Salicibibacter halophilus TaxID=2502791 RepID=A0A514LGG7_9BACI|nr:hypothetical protein [Salicibibacter halophilus]QDI90929.1 hypothetical protein EPH95_06835 [Salicibibacter halophilus]
MLKINSVSLLLLLSLFLIGCQNNNLNLSGNVSSIEVYEWDSDEQIAIIEDIEYIEELVIELDNARTETTANLDYELPDYELLFKNDEETVFDIGYYNQLMNLGVEGRYLDVSEDLIYGLELQLPLD